MLQVHRLISYFSAARNSATKNAHSLWTELTNLREMPRIFLLLIFARGSTAWSTPSTYDEYDCDSNGAKDCNAWNFLDSKCSQPKSLHLTDIAAKTICVKGATFGVLGISSQQYLCHFFFIRTQLSYFFCY